MGSLSDIVPVSLQRGLATACLAGLLALAGCTTTVESMPERTTQEQLMLSYAVRDSLDAWQMPALRDRRVYLDTRYLESYDDRYVIGAVRDWVGRQGALLVSYQHEAELRLELRAAAVGMGARERLIGVPSFALPIPGTAPIETPELALFKEARRKGLAALAVTAFDVETGERLFGDGPRIGQTYRNDAKLLYIPIARTRYNIPEEAELWHPEPDPRPTPRRRSHRRR